MLEAFAIKKREISSVVKPEKISRFRTTSRSQDICAATHTTPEDDNRLDNLGLFIQVKETTGEISCM